MHHRQRIQGARKRYLPHHEPRGHGRTRFSLPPLCRAFRPVLCGRGHGRAAYGHCARLRRRKPRSRTAADFFHVLFPLLFLHRRHGGGNGRRAQKRHGHCRRHRRRARLRLQRPRGPHHERPCGTLTTRHGHGRQSAHLHGPFRPRRSRAHLHGRTLTQSSGRTPPRKGRKAR